MTEKPIPFSGPMVRAILDGPKTQTRRVLKSVGDMDRVFQMDNGSWHVTDSKGGHMSPVTIPYAVGDLLWVRETWAPAVCTGNSWHVADGPGDDPRKHTIKFRADPGANQVHGRWRPSMFMPRWASRITLEVTAVKVERLQDISEDDAWAEGCKRGDPTDNGGFFPAEEPDSGGRGTVGWDSARDWFADLWESINGPDSWDKNPWCACYSFKRLT